MNRIQLILVGALLVGIIGIMTMIASYPKFYSPYSFTVVIPALFASGLDFPTIILRIVCVIPLTVLYLAWVFVFVRSPFKISLAAKVIAALLVLFSAAFNISAFSYGLKYQGEIHTYLMYVYNFAFVLSLALIVWSNIKKPSLNTSLGFSVLLFTWLGWVAFPWLGELI